MTNDQLNKRLAELLGWSDTEIFAGRGIPPNGSHDPWDPYRHKQIPNYADDLNAVHEVLMNSISDEQYGVYSENLTTLWLQGEFKKEPTAKQCTEALIRTLEEHQ